jgi:hypothetical protein
MRSIRLISMLFVAACIGAMGCKGRAAARVAAMPVGDHKDPNSVQRVIGAAPNPSALNARPGS